MKIRTDELMKEFQFRTSRSGGKGGQNVNKVSSRVELFWEVKESLVFNEQEKERILNKLANRINKDGFLQIVSDEDRSQLRNKQNVVNRTIYLLTETLKIEKPRKNTKPGKAAIAKRLDEKKKQALKKISRRTDF
jgi:ribosome-associated protein